MNRITFSGFSDAKQHIEKYMHWHNFKRRHGSRNGLTIWQNWTQGSLRSAGRQQFEPASVDQDEQNLAVNLLEKKVQFIGG